MEMHMATVWEAVADAVPDATGADPWVIPGAPGREFDNRAARLAAASPTRARARLEGRALPATTRNEYLEAHFGVFKIRGVPVNVNYRYLDDELAYLLDNADAEAVVFHTSLARPRRPGARPAAEAASCGRGRRAARTGRRRDRATRTLIAAHDPLPRIDRREDDVYMLYTGGTTGMPKGVMYARRLHLELR